MRGLLFFFVLTLCVFSQEITFEQKLKTLEISIPTPTSYATKSQEDSLLITLPIQLAQKEQSHLLSSPFEQIQILPIASQKTQIIISGKNLTLEKSDTPQGMVFYIRSEVLKIPWWSYLYVCFFLGLCIALLLYIKKRGAPKSSQYKESFLSPKSKIISFEYEGREYIIFSNERGNLLLNHYPKETHNKDFTHLISED